MTTVRLGDRVKLKVQAAVYLYRNTRNDLCEMQMGRTALVDLDDEVSLSGYVIDVIPGTPEGPATKFLVQREFATGRPYGYSWVHDYELVPCN